MVYQVNARPLINININVFKESKWVYLKDRLQKIKSVAAQLLGKNFSDKSIIYRLTQGFKIYATGANLRPSWTGADQDETLAEPNKLHVGKFGSFNHKSIVWEF